MPNTHCLPSGTLGSHELPVSNHAAINISTVDPGSGNRRGIVVFLHPLTGVISSFPEPIPNTGSAGFYNRIGDFGTAVVADGWIFMYPSVHEDFFSGAGSQGIW